MRSAHHLFAQIEQDSHCLALILTFSTLAKSHRGHVENKAGLDYFHTNMRTTYAISKII